MSLINFKLAIGRLTADNPRTSRTDLPDGARGRLLDELATDAAAMVSWVDHGVL